MRCVSPLHSILLCSNTPKVGLPGGALATSTRDSCRFTKYQLCVANIYFLFICFENYKKLSILKNFHEIGIPGYKHILKPL